MDSSETKGKGGIYSMIDTKTYQNPYFHDGLCAQIKDEMYVDELTVLEGKVPTDFYGAYVQTAQTQNMNLRAAIIGSMGMECFMPFISKMEKSAIVIAISIQRPSSMKPSKEKPYGQG